MEPRERNPQTKLYSKVHLAGLDPIRSWPEVVEAFNTANGTDYSRAWIFTMGTSAVRKLAQAIANDHQIRQMWKGMDM